MTDGDGLREQIEQQLHGAEDALVHGDAGPRIGMWSHRDPVTLFAALGVSKAGWHELAPMFRKVATRLTGGRDVSYELISFEASGDIAWAIGISRFTVGIDGGPIKPYALRLTNLFRREDGAWRVVHEHSDFQPHDHPAPEMPPVAG